MIRRSDRAALWVAAILATWVNLAINILVWEGAYAWRHALGLPLAAINYQLSVWPVLVDIVILMATLALTRAQMRASDRQSAVTDSIATLAEGLQLVLTTMQRLDQGDAQDLDELVAFIRALGPVRRDLDRLLAAHGLPPHDGDGPPAPVTALLTRGGQEE